MSLQDIYDALSAATHDGTTTLSSTTVGGLDLTLEAIGIVPGSTLVLTGATLGRGTDSIVLSGTATYRSFGWTTTLTGQSLDPSDPSVNRFTLVMQGLDRTQPWTLGTSFPDLPASRRIDGASLPLVPSVLAPLVVATPTISVTTQPPRPATPFVSRLEGWVVLTGSALEEYAAYFGSPRLRLTGGVDFSVPAAPVISARAVAPNAQLRIPVITVREVGLKLQSNYPDMFSLQPDAVMSTAAVYASITIGSKEQIPAEVSAPLLQGDFIWPLSFDFPTPVTAARGIALLLEFFGQNTDVSGLFAFPLAETVLTKFGLRGVEVGVQPPLGGQSLALVHATMKFTSVEEWKPTLAFVTVKELGAAWTYHWYGSTEFVTGNVWGRLTFFDETPALEHLSPEDAAASKIELFVGASLPDFVITGASVGEIRVPLGKVLKKYLGGSGGLSDDLRITRVSVMAIPSEQTYQAWMSVEGIWATTVNKVTFSIDKILAELNVTQNRVFGSITAWTSVIVTTGTIQTTKASFYTSAEYRRDGTWNFEGGLAEGELDVVDFAWGLLGAEPTVTLPSIKLTELRLSYSTALEGSANPYSASGTLELSWKPEVLGLTLSAAAKAKIARRFQANATDAALAAAAPARADGRMIYEGELYGIFKVNQLTITIGLSFVDQETVYSFEVSFKNLKLRAATEWVDDRPQLVNGTALPYTAGDPVPRHQRLLVTLGGFTLGDVVEYFVNLANPNANYQLEAPWTFLNAIDLSRFELRIDPSPKERSVTLTYRLDLTTPVISLKSVGLRYDRSSGEGKVNFVLEGSFLGKTYDLTHGNPLTWDAVNDSPPAVPGKGPRLFELRYLGAGQHVTLTNLLRFDSITEVLGELRKEMTPVQADGNPFSQSKIKFDASSQWMFGIDCTVMETVTVGIVLHDPDLYGLVISLAGPESGSLAGLSFELRYQKVTDDVGVFRVRLQVPDMFRQINFGYFSITLGVITVDVFTNGNFKVDLGFPKNKDFSSSFGLEAGPFIGSGGVYFGLLNGATSSRVPAITNGAFDPVLELGIGLAVGVGRTFNKGPIKAGLYVQLVAIFEGVLGWFHPTDESAPKAMYYWGQGTAGIIGKLYGTADFVVVSVSVSIEAHAFVSVTFAAHRETLVELDVGVEVNAEISILGISVSFSFSTSLEASFTIGETTPTPWTLAADQSGRTPGRLSASVVPPHRRRPTDVRRTTRELHLRERLGRRGARARLVGAEPAPYELDWIAVPVFPDGAVHPVPVTMRPAFTIDRIPVRWPGQAAPPNPSPAYRIAFVLMADTAVPPSARTIAETRAATTDHLAGAATTGDVAVNVLIEAMLRWSVAALGLNPVTGVVTPGQLEELAAQLDMPATTTDLDMGTLSAFFLQNLELRISGTPSGGPPAQSSGSIFPIPPPLGWTSGAPAPDPDARRFDAYQPVDDVYGREVRAYFAHLDPDPGAARRPTPNEDVTPESMATFMFRDYFLMLAKASVDAAIQVMRAFPFDPSKSLGDIARTFPTVTDSYVKRAGDTVDQVAAWYGLALSEVLWLNPTLKEDLKAAADGSPVNVKLGVTPESILAGNPSWPLTPGGTLPLGDLPHQVFADETLAGIATALGADVTAWLQTGDLLHQRDLLAVGSPLTLPASSFVNAGALDTALVAAFFYVRLNGTHDLGTAGDASVPLVEWYVQAISGLNTIVDGELPPDVTVPAAFDELTQTVTWKTQPGDDVWGVAATFALHQNPSGNANFTAWVQKVTTLNPGTSPLPRVLLPATATEIHPGETLAALADRLPVQTPATAPGQWLPAPESFRAIVQGQKILGPLALVTVPGCHATVTSGQKAQTFAASYGLSLEEAGSRLAEVDGLLAAWPKHTLLVPHPPAAPLGTATPGGADLVAAVIKEHGPTIAAQAARFLVSGLRMPAPERGSDGKYHATGPLTALYDLVGQQLAAPAPPATCPPASSIERMRITVESCDPAATWLKLYASATLGDDGATTEDLYRLNPGLSRRGPVGGLVALTDPVTQLVFSVTDDDLCAYYPATELEQVFKEPLSPRASHRDVPVRHGLQHRILWQTTETIALPNPQGVTPPANAMPAVWPLSPDLIAAARAFPSTAFALYSVDPQLGPAAEPGELKLYAWAATVDVRVKTIPGTPGVYQVFGADTTGRQQLLDLWQYLDQHSSDVATIHVCYRESPAAGMATGLVSTVTAPATTFVVKTNLSTRTQSGPQTLVEGDPPPTYGDYYASVADAARFLTLVWECSVVGGGGYWLSYATPDGGALPDSIFAADGTATLSLVVTVNTQVAATDPDRTIHSFDNCALVGDAVDPSASNLFAQTADRSETRREATVAQGNVAFSARLENPPPQTWPAIDKQIALRQLYSLVSYQLGDSQTFSGSSPSMPVAPQVPPRAPHEAPSDEEVWDIFQVLPIWRYAKSHPLPVVNGLPPPQGDPYAGVNGATKDAKPVMASTNVLLWFRDVLGNTSLQDGTPAVGGPQPLVVPVGYTDPVIGVGSWPATTGYFEIAPGDGGTGANLVARFNLQTATHLPGGSQRARAATKTAADHLARFTSIYYQVSQPDVTIALESTLETAGSVPSPLATSGSMRSLVYSACAWLWTTAQLLDEYVDVVQAPALEDASAHYGVGYEELATANPDVPLSRVFPAPAVPPVRGVDFTIPRYATFKRNDTIAAIATAGGVDPVTVLSDDENTSLPLATVELAIPPHPYAVPADGPGGPPTIASIAETNHVGLASLVRANEKTGALLRAGFVFECDGVEIVLTADTPDLTLDDVAASFEAAGIQVDAVAVCADNATKPGMFRPGATLSIDRYGTIEGETLALNGSGSTALVLAPLNTTTPDLFHAGTSIYLESLPVGAAFDDTLADVAGAFGVPSGQLLRHNRAVRLAAVPSPALGAAYLAIPGHARLPAAPASLRIPYAIPSGATLDGIAALFVNADPAQPSPAVALAIANAGLPGILAAEQTIQVGEHSVATVAGDTFSSVAARFDPAVSLGAVAAAIETRSGFLVEGGVILTPPAKLPTTKAAYTPHEVATLYGVDVEALASANGGLSGTVAGSVPLTSPGGGDPPPVSTGAGDTFASFVWRFAQARVETTLVDVLKTNKDVAFIPGGATLLLGPPRVTLVAPFGRAGWKFPGAIFEVDAWLRIARNPDLVDEDMRGTPGNPGTAVTDRTALPTLPRYVEAGESDKYLAMQQFAKDVETAVPALRVATGTARSEAAEGHTGVFGVAFGTGYIGKVTVAPGVTAGSSKIPRYFALRPLENELVTRAGVQVKPLQADGTLGPAASMDFQGVDLEILARRFLSDIELFLSAPYASAAYRTPARGALEKCLAAKASLAAGIATGLDYVLDLGQPDPSRETPAPPDWSSAVEALRQRLLADLVAGYAVDAVVQYDSEATTPWTAEVARLSGTGVLADHPEIVEMRATVGSAKTSLATTLPDAPAYVDFLLEVAEDGLARTADLDLTYCLNELEFGVTPVVDGYDASDWLSFVRSFDDNFPAAVTLDLGSPSVPLPVRAYPPLPSLLGQTATASHAEPADYTHALHWDYAFTYQHQSVEADEVRVRVDLNQAPLVTGDATTGEDRLFEALVQYDAVAAGLWEILGGLPDYEKAPDKQQVRNAMDTFRLLAQDVAANWSLHWSAAEATGPRRMAVTGPAPETYEFVQTMDASFDETEKKYVYTSLYLQRGEATGSLGWPVMSVLVDGVLVGMGAGTDTPRGRKYDFPPNVEAFRLVAYEMRFSELHVATYQNASAQVQVVRNAHLSDVAPTRPAFVYQTQSFAFPNPATPLLSWRTPFPMGRWDWSEPDNPLAAVFTAMFDGVVTGRTISCGIRYGYELATGPDASIVPYLPVRYKPKFTYAAAPGGTLTDVIATVKSWNDAEKPTVAGGRWLFNLCLFSSVGGQVDRPLLELPVYAMLT